MSELTRYSDQIPTSLDGLAALRQSRARSAREDLLLLLPSGLRPSHIVEVGPGIGGVTIPLMEMFPNSRISTIDHDPRDHVRRTANYLQTRHIKADVTQLKPEKLNTLVGDAQLVVALRTSADVARHLLNTLNQTDFSGTLVFSLFEETDGKNMREIANSVLNREGRIFHLIQMRGINEVAYVVQ